MDLAPYGPFRSKMAGVLIVDDNLLICTLLRQILERAGHTVAGDAPDGVTALSQVAALDPELVILDLVIPRLDGLATLQALRRDNPRLPVIICSAGLTRSRVIRALQLGANAFIAKPFDRTTVLDTVTQAMARTDATPVPATWQPSAISQHEAPEERRNFPRAQIALPVLLTPSTGPSILATTLDISGGGMLLTTRPLAPNAVVDFALELNRGDAPITGRAHVVRDQAGGQALAFDKVSLTDHERLMRLINSIAPAPSATGGAGR